MKPGTIRKAFSFVSKTRGVPAGPGQPPGPPPRPGLEWDGQKHRWVSSDKSEKPTSSGSNFHTALWDWKDQPDEEEITSALRNVSGLKDIGAAYYDLGDDNFYLVFYRGKKPSLREVQKDMEAGG